MTTRRDQRVLLGRLRVTLAELDAERAALDTQRVALEEVCAAGGVVLSYLEQQLAPAPQLHRPMRTKPESPGRGCPSGPPPPKQPVRRPVRPKPVRPVVYGEPGQAVTWVRSGPPELVAAANGKPISKTIRDRLQAARSRP